MSSRSQRRPSDYSRGSSPRVNRALSVTEAGFQNLGLSETVAAPQLSITSPYQSSSTSRRRPSTLRSEVSSEYLSAEYDPTSYRSTSPASYSSLQPSSTYGSSLLETDYDQLFADAGSFSGRVSPFSNTPPVRTTMG